MSKNTFFKNILPHLIATGIFAALAIAFMLPVLQNKVLTQHDTMQSQAMRQEITENFEKTGEWSLWTGSMFSGMPVYQIYMNYPSSLVTHVITIFKTVFPQETYIVFLLMLGFYILLFTFTWNTWVSVIGGFAFAFASLNLINIEAGHTNKALCIALMAPVLAGIIAAFNGRYLFGAAIAGLTLAMQIRANHLQITYYTFIVAGVVALYYLVIAIKEKQFASFTKAVSLLAFAAVLSVGSNAAQLWTTYEYAKETIRGGTSELSEERSSGLDKDYAFSWSYGKMETFSIVIPYFKGGASQESLGEDSKLAEELRKKGVPKIQVSKIMKGVPTYWGTQPFTSGPTYFGAITCFLFILGMFLVKNSVKWAFFAIAVLTIMLSWGENFEAFNMLFFNYFPMYNKFRTPAMILSVADLAFVFIAGLAIFELLTGKIDKNDTLQSLKISLGISLGIVFTAGILGSYIFDFKAQADEQLASGGWPVEALRADRASMLRSDAFRSLMLIALAGALIWGFIENKLKSNYILIALGALTLLDVWTVSKRYLNDDDFSTRTERESYYRPTKANLEILRDKDLSYRVLNLTTSTFNDALTSYFHKSIGGYHAAKIRRYQDLIENRITENMQRLSKGFENDNIPVLNMLNMRYIIAKDDNVIRNPNAMGNAWFVPGYKLVEDAKAEMNALASFNPAREAIVDNSFESYLQGLPAADNDASGSVILTFYSPDKLSYKATTSTESLAVFSEVYYNNGKGWKAYLDGKPVEHIRVNYVLRAMRIPAGEHVVEFKFEPKSYYLGEKISLACSWLILLLFFGMLVVEVKKLVR